MEVRRQAMVVNIIQIPRVHEYLQEMNRNVLKERCNYSWRNVIYDN